VRPAAFERIAVVGCGLIGGSFALASQQVEGVTDVVVWDRDQASRKRAVTLGVGTRVARDIADAVRGAQLVLLGVPSQDLAELAQLVAPHLEPGSLVTDVASVKTGAVAAVEGALAGHGLYIGGHPMAGSENSGVQAADATLFQGAAWLLTPTIRTDDACFARLAGHVVELGARVLAVSPDEHDRLVAVASHLPQVLASVLMDYAATLDDAPLRVAAGGFRDVTRVAASDPELWVGILTENRVAVLDALDGFAGRLSSLRSAIDKERWDGVRGLFESARASRRALPRRGLTAVLVDLVVPIPDRPGSLALVMSAMADAAINVEDVSMRHATDGQRGSLILAVDGLDQAHLGQEALAARGMVSHVDRP
jgi:prephenate dehydrogenase